jgi:CspA family cold shock protein
MKNKIFLSSALVVTVLFAATAIGVGEVSAATGDLTNIFPPGNKGTARGVGMIDGHDGNKYVFRTPGDNDGKELKEGDEVFFEPGNGRKVHSVTQESDSPIGEAVSGLIDEIRENDTVEFELQEGKKGLNAVNVKVLSRDRSKPMWEWVQANIVGREMVMPGDNVLCIDGAKIVIDRDSGRSTGHDDDCDGIPEERGDKVIQIIKGIRNTGHINVMRFRTIGDIIERVQETLVGCELDVCAQVRKNADERHGLIEEAGPIRRTPSRISVFRQRLSSSGS